jgi:hypothetical protein
MLCSTLNPESLLRASRLLARSAGLAVCHESEVLLFNHVVTAKLIGGQSPVPDQCLHPLDSDSQPRGHLFSSK